MTATLRMPVNSSRLKGKPSQPCYDFSRHLSLNDYMKFNAS